MGKLLTVILTIVGVLSVFFILNYEEQHSYVIVCLDSDSTFPNKELGKFTLSWYSPKELGKTKAHELRTSTGTIPKEGRTVAVDPKIIPYGSIIYIKNYGYFIAEDCGSKIKGNRIDIYTDSYETAIKNGKKQETVWIMQ